MRRSMARKGKAKKARLKPCMYVCMSGWMCMGRGRGFGVDLLCDGISDAYICPAGVLASRPDMRREADQQEDADGAQGSPTCSQFIARKKLLPARPLARFRIA